MVLWSLVTELRLPLCVCGWKLEHVWRCMCALNVIFYKQYKPEPNTFLFHIMSGTKQKGCQNVNIITSRTSTAATKPLSENTLMTSHLSDCFRSSPFSFQITTSLISHFHTPHFRFSHSSFQIFIPLISDFHTPHFGFSSLKFHIFIPLISDFHSSHFRF